jgi:predicted RNA-binding Zn-ribbon protein involved in translation (DUF1610 family)
MTRIRATCPSCGEVDLQPTDIRLEIVGDGDIDVRDGSYYAFSCPDCAGMVTKPADDRIARLLRSGGVVVTYRSVSPQVDAEIARAVALLDHPEGMPVAPPLTPDDLLDFHLFLQGEHWFDELLALVH